MRKSLFIISLVIIALLTTITYVFAANNSISLEGKTTVDIGETSTVTVKISSDDTIGVVSGKIEFNPNITNVQVTGKNNWAVQYNEEIGVFNAYKAEGAKTEDIIEIKYTASSTEGTGKITLSNIELTSINYESQNINNITKTITIKNTIQPDTENEESGNNTGDKTDKEEGNNTTGDDENIDNKENDTTDNNDKENNATSNNGNSNNEGDATNEETEYQNNIVTNTEEKKSDGAKDNSDLVLEKTEFPNTGKVKGILPIFIVIISILVSSYLGYKKYKGIN